MMNRTLKFTDDKHIFEGSVDFDLDSNVLHGKILHINSVISYEGDTLNELTEAFFDAVKDYLEMCDEMGVIPEKPYKGSFNIRIPPELHRQASLLAFRHGKTLNDFVSESISEKVKRTNQHTQLTYPLNSDSQKSPNEYARQLRKTISTIPVNQKGFEIPTFESSYGTENYDRIVHN